MPLNNFLPPYVLELVNYQLKDEVDENTFIDINKKVGEEFTSNQSGFLYREIGRNEDNTWLVAVFWKTKQDALNSINNIDEIPNMVKTYMSMINRETIKRSIYNII